MYKILLGVLLVGLVLSAKANNNEVLTKVLNYKQVDDVELKMKVYYPPSWNENAPKLPALVLFFSGGWNTGTWNQFTPQAKHLAKRGMIVICPQYRVNKVHKTTPDKSLEDAKSAMRYIYKNANTLGIDSEKIAGGGGSAGGHLAAGTYFCKGFNSSNDDLTIECKPKALILLNPVIDNGPSGYANNRVKSYWQEFSPMHNIDKNSLPVLFLLGDKDKLIPVSTGEEFKEKINSNGGNCELIIYADAEHGFFNPLIKGKKSKFHDKSTEDIDNFLVKIGYIMGKEE